MKELKITYNDKLGNVTVIEHNGKLYIKRSAYNRVWKKVTNSLGGLTKVSFDNSLEVQQLSDMDYSLLKYANR